MKRRTYATGGRVRSGFKRPRRTGVFRKYSKGRGRIATEELKFHDVDFDDAAVATAGTVEPTINIIVQGVGESQRIGRKCTIRSINWRFTLDLPSEADQADVGNGETVRVILFHDKQCNGATATVTGILESADYQSFNNLSNKGRFRTLMDRRYDLNRQVSSADGANTQSSPLFVKTDTFFKRVNIPIEYDNADGALTRMRTNNIGVLLISKTGVAGFESKFRLRFSDS